jgi:ferredoxin
MDGPAFMLITGGVLLLLGMFFGRPYCRFLCPYGVLLGWLSRLNWKHVKITPTNCITCGLCADACPYDAILPPKPKATDRRKIAKLLALTPALVLAGVILGLVVAPLLADLHPQNWTLEGDPQELPQEIRSQFTLGTAILGGFIGLMGGVLLLREPLRKPTLEYTIDPVTCLSCGRCFTSCPKESEFRLETLCRTPAAIPAPETVPSTEETADVVARS